MSYCRWSSDNFRCDIYAYEHVNGFYSINVAAKRRVGTISAPPNINEVPMDIFMEAYRQRDRALGSATLVPIGLPHDGETFNEPTLEDAIDRMRMLRAAGYIVPEYAIEAMEEEMKDALPPKESEMTAFADFSAPRLTR